MLPLRSNNVWILTAPLEYFPGAQVNSFRLREIVVESNANTSLTMSTLGISVFAFIGLTRVVRSIYNIANMEINFLWAKTNHENNPKIEINNF